MSVLRTPKSAGPGRVRVEGRIQGAGTDAPSVTEGVGFTVARSDVGLWTITFSRKYKALISFEAGFQASTPADLAGHSVVVDDLATGDSLPLSICNASNDLHDLDANEYLNFVAVFRETALTL